MDSAGKADNTSPDQENKKRPREDDAAQTDAGALKKNKPNDESPAAVEATKAGEQKTG